MSGAIDQAVYMGVGSSGAMTDVSAYVDLQAGITYDYGRESEFDDTLPGTFSFTLDNADGRFTPENTSSPYATTLTEGMQVCWQAGSRLVTGSVIGIEPAFPGDDAAWAQVVVTCDDMLGSAAREEIYESLSYAAAASSAYLFFPLDDPAGSLVGVGYRNGAGEATYLEGPDSALIYPNASLFEFGVDGVDGVSSTQLGWTAAAGSSGRLGAHSDSGVTAVGLLEDPDYPFSVGMWVTPMNTTSYLEVVGVAGAVPRWGIQNGDFTFYDGSTWTPVLSLIPETPYYVELVFTSGPLAAALYIDGVQVASTTFAIGILNTEVAATLGDAAYGDSHVRLSHWSLSPTRLNVAASMTATEADRLTLIDAASAAITMDTLPNLAEATVGPASGGSLLDAINEVIRAEQGHVYTATTGTVDNPTQKVIIRERDRPTAVTETFDAEDEASGAPEIVRDVTNLLAAATIVGPSHTVRVTITGSRADATASEPVVLEERADLKAWGEDRLIRGANTRLRVASFPVDAFTTPADRSADLLGLVPGDRVQITDLPETQLGFSAWDGWLLGAHEEHGIGTHLFELKLQPVLDDHFAYDTGMYGSGGALTLNADINSAVTSIVYATTGPEFTTTLPVSILVDQEQMTVTACNTGTNTLTVTRGAGGTTAASHLAAAAIELLTPAVYAF